MIRCSSMVSIGNSASTLVIRCVGCWSCWGMMAWVRRVGSVSLLVSVVQRFCDEGAYFAWRAEDVLSLGGLGAAEAGICCCSWVVACEVAAWAYQRGDFGCYGVFGWVTAAAVLVESCVEGVDRSPVRSGVVYSVLRQGAGENGIG